MHFPITLLRNIVPTSHHFIRKSSSLHADLHKIFKLFLCLFEFIQLYMGRTSSSGWRVVGASPNPPASLWPAEERSAQWLYRFTFLPAVEQGSFSSTPSPAFIIRRLLFLSCCETCRKSQFSDQGSTCAPCTAFAFDVLGFLDVSVHLPRSHYFPKHWGFFLLIFPKGIFWTMV